MSDQRKYEAAEYTNWDGSPLAVDPADIIGVGIGKDPDTEEPSTRVYCTEAYWAVQEGYVEALQVWLAAKTNNLLFEIGE
jgi:hypothetical protein